MGESGYGFAARREVAGGAWRFFMVGRSSPVAGAIDSPILANTSLPATAPTLAHGKLGNDAADGAAYSILYLEAKECIVERFRD